MIATATFATTATSAVAAATATAAATTTTTAATSTTTATAIAKLDQAVQFAQSVAKFSSKPGSGPGAATSIFG